MADVFLFIEQGWKSIWKQRIIFLFSTIIILADLVSMVQNKYLSSLTWQVIYGVMSLAWYFFYLVSFIGVSYLAYCFLVDRSVTIRETLLATRKFFGRIFGTSCLTSLIILPCFFLTVGISKSNSIQSTQFSTSLSLLTLIFSIFIAFWQFIIAGFFAQNYGIWQSLKESWILFTSHFGTLAILGIIFTVIIKVYGTACGVLTLLIQSGFDLSAFASFNFIDPSISLKNNLLFLLLSGIGGIIWQPFTASVFMLAYLKYSGVKARLLVKQR